MLGKRKPFDEDRAEWSSRAERELGVWLRRHGYDYSPLPDGKFGCDGVAENGHEKFTVEVERTEPDRWTGDRWHQPDVRVLERRKDKLASGSLLFVVRSDIRRALVVFPYSLLPDRLKPFRNKCCDGEFGYHVPVIEACPIDLADGGGDPIAVINARRVRQAYRDAVTPHGKLTALHDWPPYGMSEDEWRELRDAAERPVEQRALCDCRTITWSRVLPCLVPQGQKYSNGKQPMYCRHCGRFYGAM